MREDTARKKLDRGISTTSKPAEKKTFKVNNVMLSLMVKDNRKTNCRMDNVNFNIKIGRNNKG